MGEQGVKIIHMNSQREQIKLVFDGAGGLGAIYISNWTAAKNSQTLKNHSITAVLSAGRGLILTYPNQHVRNYLYLPVDDTEEESLSPFLETSFAFIEASRKKGNVLVHCYMGISRSSALTAAYLIRKYGYSMPQSVSLLRRRKPNVNPNRSFIKQLHLYQQVQYVQQEGEYQRIRDSLVGSVSRLNHYKDDIDDKIKKAHESVSNRSKQKRSKSEYLQKKVQDCLKERSRKNSCYDQPASLGQIPLDGSSLFNSLNSGGQVGGSVRGKGKSGGLGNGIDMTLLQKKLVGIS